MVPLVILDWESPPLQVTVPMEMVPPLVTRLLTPDPLV